LLCFSQVKQYGWKSQLPAFIDLLPCFSPLSAQNSITESVIEFRWNERPFDSLTIFHREDINLKEHRMRLDRVKAQKEMEEQTR